MQNTDGAVLASGERNGISEEDGTGWDKKLSGWALYGKGHAGWFGRTLLHQQILPVQNLQGKQEFITSLTAEITTITANINTLKANLKEKKAALKVAEKELNKLETKKAAADQKAVEEAKKAEAENVVKKLLASGMSADEILEKLK